MINKKQKELIKVFNKLIYLTQQLLYQQTKTWYVSKICFDKNNLLKETDLEKLEFLIASKSNIICIVESLFDKTRLTLHYPYYLFSLDIKAINNEYLTLKKINNKVYCLQNRDLGQEILENL